MFAIVGPIWATWDSPCGVASIWRLQTLTPFSAKFDATFRNIWRFICCSGTVRKVDQRHFHHPPRAVGDADALVDPQRGKIHDAKVVAHAQHLPRRCPASLRLVRKSLTLCVPPLPSGKKRSPSRLVLTTSAPRSSSASRYSVATCQTLLRRCGSGKPQVPLECLTIDRLDPGLHDAAAGQRQFARQCPACSRSRGGRHRRSMLLDHEHVGIAPGDETAASETALDAACPISERRSCSCRKAHISQRHAKPLKGQSQHVRLDCRVVLCQARRIDGKSRSQLP